MYHINVIIAMWWYSLQGGNQYFYDKNSMSRVSVKHLTRVICVKHEMGEREIFFLTQKPSVVALTDGIFSRELQNEKKRAEQRYQKVRSGKTKKTTHIACCFSQRSLEISFLFHKSFPFCCQCFLFIISFYDLIKILIGFLFQLVFVNLAIL